MNAKQFIALTAALLLLCMTPLSAQAENGAPICQNLELETYRGIAVDGQLKATSVLNTPLTFQLSTPPIKGEVEINSDGSFVYKPDPKRRGKDYFGYTATDTQGNVSQEATVIITLLKPKTSVTYGDMADSPLHYDALRMAEAGLFTGEMIGGNHVFSPETMIGKGEFLTMCMTLSQLPILTSVTETGFSDDAGIPTWQKPYIATARMYGTIAPVNEAGSTDFVATSPITCAQAAVMIDGIFSLSKVSAANIGSNTPDWAAQSVANLIACNVLPADCDSAQYLNRGMAADMLSALMDVLEER